MTTSPFSQTVDCWRIQGTIGLSIVQRIINWQGGRIWAEAEPGRGAAFFFTLPD